MFQRTVSYKSLLSVLGGCFLLYGLFLIMLALTSQIVEVGSIQYTGPLIFEDPSAVRNYILWGGLFPGNAVLPSSLNTFGPLTPGPLLWVSIGMLCLSVASLHVHVVYICLQIALWLISFSVWFPIFFLLGSTSYDLGSFVPFVLVTLAFSLALLVSYKPMTHFLRKLFGLKKVAPIVKM